MIKNMSPEVLMYIQTVKQFLDKNEESKRYFLKNVDEETFFKNLEEVAQKNFNSNGEPMLTEIQFELLKRATKVIQITKKENINNIFIDMPGFQPICLN
jgi:hypothetical protein